jgi:hypothetical protein
LDQHTDESFLHSARRTILMGGYPNRLKRRWNDVDVVAVVFSNNQWTSTQPSPFRNEDVTVPNVLWTRRSEMLAELAFSVGLIGLIL